MNDAAQSGMNAPAPPPARPTITFGIQRSRERDAAARISPLTTLPKTRTRDLRWRVDWARVASSERWRERHWHPAAGRRVIAQTQHGNLTLKAVVKAPEERADGGLVISGPKNARTIHAVLLSRCAGYVKAPCVEDVVCGIKNAGRNDAQATAIRTFLREATADQVRKAWKAGEFTIAELMRAAEQVVDDDDMRTTHSIRRWLIIEPRECEPNG